MTQSKRRPFTAFMIAVTVSTSSWLASRTKADDAASAALRRVAEQQFDMTFFEARRDPSVEAAQVRLSRVLKKRIEAIHRSCGLNDSQTKKLELAGRVAIKRLIDSIAEQKEAFLAEERTALAVSRYLHESPDILALRKKLRDGPFDEESLFAKTLVNVLSPEQSAKYAKRRALAARANRSHHSGQRR